MSETSTLIGYSGRTIGREELALVPTPAATETHRPVPHHEIVQALVETLGFRHIGVVHDEYAVSPDGMKAFGVFDLATEMEGCRFSIGLRNSHDKSMRLAMTCGYRVFVCSNMAFAGDFTPVLAKHSKSFSLIDCISVGVDRMQRNFEPMRKQVEAWQRSELTDVTAKVVIYEAFVEGRLEAPKHLARTVHDLYFEPKYEEFRPRTIWSLSNAFTSAFQGTRSHSAIQGYGQAGRIPLAQDAVCLRSRLSVQLKSSWRPGLTSSGQRQTMGRIEARLENINVLAWLPEASMAYPRLPGSHPRSDHDGGSKTS